MTATERNTLIWRTLTFILIIGTICTAQDIPVEIRNDSSLPLQLETAASVPVVNSEYFQTTARVRSMSTERIVAYVLAVTYKLSNGKASDAQLIVDHRALGFSQPAPSAIPTEGTAEPPFSSVRFPKGASVKSIVISVAYVETESGRVYGPQTEKYRTLLSAQRQARRQERERLNGVLRHKGPNALADEITKQ